MFRLRPQGRSVTAMPTLIEVRERCRASLADAAAGVWSDEHLDRHIEQALAELSLSIPRELAATLATAEGSRTLTVTLDGLIEIEAAEYPTGQFPPAFIGFSSWGTSVSLHLDVAPDGSDVKLYYTAAHTLDEDGSTLPDSLTGVLVTGATAYAAEEQASGTANTLNLDPTAGEHYAAWARARRTAFRQLLHTYGRKNRVRTRRTYLPA